MVAALAVSVRASSLRFPLGVFADNMRGTLTVEIEASSLDFVLGRA
jgi:hypothetical protein